jgi:ArsR family transcriptional regulator
MRHCSRIPSSGVDRWQTGGVTDVLPGSAPSPTAPTPTPATTGDGCCTPAAPLVGAAVDAGEAEQLARRFQALADPTRVRLLSLIGAHPAGEACVCDLTEPVGLAQGTVSFHLKRLVDGGLLVREQRGRWAFYRLVDGALGELADSLRRF